MKVFLFVAASLLTLPSAFAQNVEIQSSNDQVFEQEYGPMSDADVQDLYSSSMQMTERDRGAEIIGGLIGGVIGGIIGGNGPGHGGPGHGGPGHGGGGHGGPGHGGPNQVTCFAQDWRRNVYRASGFDWRRVQYRAVQKCEQFSHARCRALGCR